MNLFPSEPQEDETSAEMRLLATRGVGPLIRRSLIERFGSAAAVFTASPSELREVPGIGPKVLKNLHEARQLDIAAELAYCAEHRITIITQQHPHYPRGLREIPDPPGLLFARGELLPTDQLAIAIVGSRHATQYGLTQAERLAASLSRAGLTVISGLARGIDAAAHRGALAAGGRTLAVLGSGVMHLYPPEHVSLAHEILEQGAILSETRPLCPPDKGTFPQRNRIVTGMSLGVIVVEAAVSSGALISARHAMEQGREVFAVPGRIDSRTSHGCHRLIRDGAKLVETADDVLEELGPLIAPITNQEGQKIHHPAELQLNEVEHAVLAAVGSEATSIDQVVATSDLPAGQVLATISILEMRRLVRRVSGNYVLRP